MWRKDDGALRNLVVGDVESERLAVGSGRGIHGEMHTARSSCGQHTVARIDNVAQRVALVVRKAEEETSGPVGPGPFSSARNSSPAGARP